jgi:hypothetical protein
MLKTLEVDLTPEDFVKISENLLDQDLSLLLQDLTLGSCLRFKL